jgi:hypothetical protein
MDNILREKLTQAQVPGCIVEFDPDEAEQAGAFEEDAITVDDAKASAPDFVEEAP